MTNEAIKTTAANLAAELFAKVGGNTKAPKTAKVAKSAPTPASEVRVVSVQDNPKKAGSAAHARYNLWKLGMNEAEALAAGLTKADIAHDVKKGFVRFAL